MKRKIFIILGIAVTILLGIVIFGLLSYYMYIVSSAKAMDYVKVANSYMQSKRYDEAIVYYEKALKEYPYTIKAEQGLLKALIEKKEFTSAIFMKKQQMLVAKDDLWNIIRKGEIGKLYLFNRQLELAKQYYENYLQEYPRGPLGYLGLSTAHSLLGDNKKALDYQKIAVDKIKENIKWSSKLQAKAEYRRLADLYILNDDKKLADEITSEANNINIDFFSSIPENEKKNYDMQENSFYDEVVSAMTK